MFSMFFFIGIKAYAATPTSYSTTNWSEVTKTQNTTPKNIWELKNVDIVHYTGNVTIKSSSFTIPENKTLIITGNLLLDYEYSKYLTVTGNLLVEGNLTMEHGGLLSIGDHGVVFIKKNLLGTTGKINIICHDANRYGTFMCDSSKISSIKVTYSKNQASGNAVYIDDVIGSIDINGGTEGDKAREKGTKLFEEMGALGLLPIKLSSFVVKKNQNGYTFNWITASEVENDYYTLEFSENGEEFIAIDYISGAGTTSETTEYEYVWDANPKADVLYFRLKQTDYNGEFTYSDILVFAPKKSHGANRILYYGPLKLNVVDGQLQYIAE